MEDIEYTVPLDLAVTCLEEAFSIWKEGSAGRARVPRARSTGDIEDGESEKVVLDDCTLPRSEMLFASHTASDAESHADVVQDDAEHRIILSITQAVMPVITEAVMSSMNQKANSLVDTLESVATKTGERFCELEMRVNAYPKTNLLLGTLESLAAKIGERFLRVRDKGAECAFGSRGTLFYLGEKDPPD